MAKQATDTKPCARCKLLKLMNEYYPDKNHSTGYSRYCKECDLNRSKEWRTNSRGAHLLHIRKRNLKASYGMTVEDYEVLLASQKNKCAICGTMDPGNIRTNHLFIDHDHNTKEIRGLLCHGCNAGLGNFKDDPIKLMSAITYLGERMRV